jgi:hypothetical protein
MNENLAWLIFGCVVVLGVTATSIAELYVPKNECPKVEARHEAGGDGK